MTTSGGDPRSDYITAKARQMEREHQRQQPLTIAVLGPGLGVPNDPEGHKRQQIYDALKDDGHKPFFPESIVNPNQPGETAIEQEVRILSRSDVDLVIILHTHKSFGALMEIGNFVGVPDIRRKTGVLFPIEYYTPDTALPGNTVRGYPVKTPYTQQHFEVCQLVGECRQWAHNRVSGEWPGVIPRIF